MPKQPRIAQRRVDLGDLDLDKGRNQKDTG